MSVSEARIAPAALREGTPLPTFTPSSIPTRPIPTRSTLAPAEQQETNAADNDAPHFCACLDGWLPTCILGFLETLCSWISACIGSISGQTERYPPVPDALPLQPLPQGAALQAAPAVAVPLPGPVVPSPQLRGAFELLTKNWMDALDLDKRLMESSPIHSKLTTFTSRIIIIARIAYQDSSEKVTKRAAYFFERENRAEFGDKMQDFLKTLETDRPIRSFDLVYLTPKLQYDHKTGIQVFTDDSEPRKWRHHGWGNTPWIAYTSFQDFEQEVTRGINKQLSFLKELLTSADFEIFPNYEPTPLT